MNAEQLAVLEHQISELEAIVRDELAKHSDDDLTELLSNFLDHPTTILTMALINNPGKLAAMAAVPIHRERLRRAEIAAMETAE